MAAERTAPPGMNGAAMLPAFITVFALFESPVLRTSPKLVREVWRDRLLSIWTLRPALLSELIRLIINLLRVSGIVLGASRRRPFCLVLIHYRQDRFWVGKKAIREKTYYPAGLLSIAAFVWKR